MAVTQQGRYADPETRIPLPDPLGRGFVVHRRRAVVEQQVEIDIRDVNGPRQGSKRR